MRGDVNGNNGFRSNQVLTRLQGSPNLAWAVDQEQRIRFMNKSCEDALGVSADEAIGKECFRVFKSLTSRGKAQCRPNCAALCAAQSGACPAMSLMRVRRPRAPEQWLHCSYVVLDEDNASFLLLHVADQVTEMVEAWSILSNYASRVSDGKYVAPITPARPRKQTGAIAIHALSTRETEVLRCLGDGLDTAQISHELTLSPHTVRNYVKRVFSKLGVHSRIEAVSVLNAIEPR